MSTYNCSNTNAINDSFKEAVCIDTKRIYDSCADKECIDGLQVFFFGNDQKIINSAIMVKAKSVEIVHTHIEVESVPFDKGFYSVDISYFFKVTLAVYCGHPGHPTTVNGLATYSKKVILYGSEGNVSTYSSQFPHMTASNLPQATVQVVEPLILACNLEEPVTLPICPVLPPCVCEVFEHAELCPPSRENKIVTISLGIFSIVQLDRRVQLLIPAYDFCIPCKDCTTASSDDPCELFAKIKFPTDEFFPPKCND